MATVSAKQVDVLLEKLPATVAAAAAEFPFTPVQRAVIDYARVRGCENVVELAASTRKTMRAIIQLKMAADALGNPAPMNNLQTALFDAFGELNRDWRRIALTEAVENSNQGYVASMPEGKKLRRLEQYHGACPWCRRIDGMVLEVVAPGAVDKNGDTQVWVGKTNLGRSAAPRRRQGGILVERQPEEMYHVAAGAQHPNCFISRNVNIYTVDGWKKIGDISIGDLVLTHKGRFRKVTWILSGARHTGDVIQIEISQDGRNRIKISEMTPEHPVLTERGWVNAGDIVIGDKVSALAKICETCRKPFVNAHHPHIKSCSSQCAVHLGINQFSTGDPIAYAAAIKQTADSNRIRMRGMTVEQRREITASARIASSALGYSWLKTPESKRKGGLTASKHNYTPSPIEEDIAEMIECLGISVDLQHRVDRNYPDAAGRKRYWWIDIALPEQKIAVEIDGEPWHGRLSGGGDSKRDDDLKLSGWNVMRFDSLNAKESPHKVAESIARLALNHSGEYTFGSADVSSISRRHVTNKLLYNFGVEEDESYIIGRGVVVHNCRGSWLEEVDDLPGEDAEFGARIREILRKK